MIQKTQLSKIIQKYYLGVNESVKWNIKDNTLKIDFTTPSQDIIGRITGYNFELEDSQLAIYETKKLFHDVTISIHKNRSAYEIFVISDKATDEEAVINMFLKNTSGDTILHKQDTIIISANKSMIYASLLENELKGLSKNEPPILQG